MDIIDQLGKNTSFVSETSIRGVDTERPSSSSTAAVSSVPSIERLGRIALVRDYALGETIGSGAASIVKKAIKRNTAAFGTTFDDKVSNLSNEWENKPVALKMIIKSKLPLNAILHDPNTGLSIPTEIFVHYHLRQRPHRNLIQMLGEPFECSQYYSIIMPLYCGGPQQNIPSDLFAYIQRRGGKVLPENVIRGIFAQLVMAVEHLHIQLGLIHGDIKDENIMLYGFSSEPDEFDVIPRLVLTDFGSAAYYRCGGPTVQRGVPPTEQQYRQSMFVNGKCIEKKILLFTEYYGTRDFIPPEVAQKRPFSGPPQDIWAMGLILHIICFQYLPVHGYEKIQSKPENISPDIDELLGRMLSPKPEHRPTIQEIASLEWITESYNSLYPE